MCLKTACLLTILTFSLYTTKLLASTMTLYYPSNTASPNTYFILDIPISLFQEEETEEHNHHSHHEPIYQIKLVLDGKHTNAFIIGEDIPFSKAQKPEGLYIRVFIPPLLTLATGEHILELSLEKYKFGPEEGKHGFIFEKLLAKDSFRFLTKENIKDPPAPLYPIPPQNTLQIFFPTQKFSFQFFSHPSKNFQLVLEKDGKKYVYTDILGDPRFKYVYTASLTPPQEGTFYWYVVADGIMSQKEEIRFMKVEIPSPIVKSPINGATYYNNFIKIFAEKTFIPTPTYYPQGLELFKLEGKTQVLLNQYSSKPQNPYISANIYLEDGDYMIRSFLAFSPEYKKYSEPIYFYVRGKSFSNDSIPPQTPQITEISNAYNNTLLLILSNANDDPLGSGIKEYIIQFSMDEKFKKTFITKVDQFSLYENLASVFVSLPEELKMVEKYYIRVRSVDRAGNQSEWSNIKNISIKR